LYIDGPLSIPPVIPTLRKAKTYKGVGKDGVKQEFTVGGNKDEYKAKLKDVEPWMIVNQLILAKIANTVPDNQVHLVKNAPHAKQAWHNLQSVY
jgi:hypothetical protein